MAQKYSLSDRFNPKEIEKPNYELWENKKVFSSEDQSTKPPFSVVLPPPNVTGQLHIGHALNHTLQDILARWKRMSGFNVMWLPGTDHAGIATQGVVERQLSQEGQTRQGIGREKFTEKVWEWKEKYGNRIVEQMKLLGESCDWDRFKFTLDEDLSRAVRKAFVELYKKDLIYKGQRLINWSPKLESALSDLEVEYKEIKGTLYHIKYPLSDGSGELTVATTRPETLFGDVVVAVHPEDQRYKAFIGKMVQLPLANRSIPVVADEYVDQTFGSGVVKITPGHDFNDYEVGLRLNLTGINILNKNGTLNENAGSYQGLSTQEARKRVVQDLKEQGYLIQEEVHTHSVGHCSRSGAVAEPLLSEQWFLKMESLSTPAIQVVANGTVTFEPELWTKTYLHWMNNIKDWCISRQLWWGHRIPAWYCQDCGHISVSESDLSVCSKCKSKNIEQEEDVLDTWFSSALWPFSTMGWPEDTEAQKTFYPTNVLITGHDIIFFWVARMIMMGLEFKGDVPFRKVLITGLVRNEQGQKMSKSLGNALDPEELIKEYGADALRFTLVAMVSSGRDLKFSMPRLEGYRNFMNKVWNATRFSLGVLEDFETPKDGDKTLPNKSDLSDADQWIIYKLGVCEALVQEHFTNYRFSDAAGAIYDFVWHQLCDWYLELIKPAVYGDKAKEKSATQLVLIKVLNRAVRLLHPIAPFITEEIYQKLPLKNNICALDEYPSPKSDKDFISLGSEKAALEIDLVCEVITAVRNVRGENRIKPGERLKVRLSPTDAEAQKVLQTNKSYIENLARLETCEISQEGSTSKCAMVPVRLGALGVDVVIYLEGFVDIAEEKKRVEKSIEKLKKELGGISQRLSNSSFVNNAPAEVVEQGKNQMAELSNKIKTMEESLSRLN